MDNMTLKLGQVQLMVGRDKAENLRRACVLIRRAAEQGAQLVMLPEMFCCPYENEMFRPNSEEQGGPAQQALSALSRELGIWIVGGTIPEREGKKLYNTCYVYDDQGRQAARHRKIHLFDVNVEGGQYFMESDTFAPGNDITLLDTPWGRVGLCVCFDLRFEELCRVMTLRGARMILAPAAFNMTPAPPTGSCCCGSGRWITSCSPWVPPRPVTRAAAMWRGATPWSANRGAASFTSAARGRRSP